MYGIKIRRNITSFFAIELHSLKIKKNSNQTGEKIAVICLTTLRITNFVRIWFRVYFSFHLTLVKLNVVLSKQIDTRTDINIIRYFTQRYVCGVSDCSSEVMHIFCSKLYVLLLFHCITLENFMHWKEFTRFTSKQFKITNIFKNFL